MILLNPAVGLLFRSFLPSFLPSSFLLPSVLPSFVPSVFHGFALFHVWFTFCIVGVAGQQVHIQRREEAWSRLRYGFFSLGRSCVWLGGFDLSTVRLLPLVGKGTVPVFSRLNSHTVFVQTRHYAPLSAAGARSRKGEVRSSRFGRVAVEHTAARARPEVPWL